MRENSPSKEYTSRHLAERQKQIVTSNKTNEKLI